MGVHAVAVGQHRGEDEVRLSGGRCCPDRSRGRPCPRSPPAFRVCTVGRSLPTPQAAVTALLCAVLGRPGLCLPLLPRGPSLPRVPPRPSGRSWFLLTGLPSPWSFLTELSELRSRVFSPFAFPSFLGWPRSFLCVSDCLGSRGPAPVWRVEICLRPERIRARASAQTAESRGRARGAGRAQSPVSSPSKGCPDFSLSSISVVSSEGRTGACHQERESCLTHLSAALTPMSASPSVSER